MQGADQNCMRVLESDVMAAVRQKGLMRLEQVRYAVVKRDGKVSIVPEGDEQRTFRRALSERNHDPDRHSRPVGPSALE